MSLRKKDISLPTDFQHRAHVGYDPDVGMFTNFEYSSNSKLGDDGERVCSSLEKIPIDGTDEPNKLQTAALSRSLDSIHDQNQSSKNQSSKDVSLPESFEHRAHVTYDPTTGKFETVGNPGFAIPDDIGKKNKIEKKPSHDRPRKRSISAPMDFQHCGHVGFDASSGSFDSFGVTRDLKPAGIGKDESEEEEKF